MGLFGRSKQETAQEIEALREEMKALRERLDATDSAKTRLEENVGELHAENGRLRDELLIQITTTASASNDATRTLAEQTAAQLDEQRARLADLAVVATDAAERAATDAAERAATHETDAELVERLAAAESQIAATIAQLNGALEQAGDAAAQAAEAAGRTAELDERVGRVDARLEQVSTELVNQLGELSSELESRSTPSDLVPPVPDQSLGLDPELVEELLDAQERLANEQARYQIAFRQDLAELADRLKRQR